MRIAAKIDANQNEIVKALRQVGCTVQSLASTGKGVPDLLVACPTGCLYLMELKDGNKPPSARKLTPDQVKWHAEWNSEVHIVLSAEQAIDIVFERKGRI